MDVCCLGEEGGVIAGWRCKANSSLIDCPGCCLFFHILETIQSRCNTCFIPLSYFEQSFCMSHTELRLFTFQRTYVLLPSQITAGVTLYKIPKYRVCSTRNLISTLQSQLLHTLTQNLIHFILVVRKVVNKIIPHFWLVLMLLVASPRPVRDGERP